MSFRERTRLLTPLRGGPLLLLAPLLGIVAGCAGLSGPPPTPVVIVVTATPGPATPPPSPVVIVVTATPGPATLAPIMSPVPVAASPVANTASAANVPPGSPGASAVTGSPVAVAAPAAAPAGAAAAASPAVPQEQSLTVNRTNAYRGLEVTVEEARSGQQIERQKADQGKTIVALRVRLHNPSPQLIHFAGTLFHERAKLRLPSGATPAAMATDPFIRPRLDSEESAVDWLYFQIDRPVPLSELTLALGGPQETIVTIPFSGPEPAIAVRRFEYLRSLDPIHDLIWSVSGGELRLDIPMQQANPNQEFIVLRIRATNVSTKEVTAGPGWGVPPEATQYLRVRADNGVLLQVSSAIHELPEYFPPKAEQDSIYAWQLPKGSKNPKLVILEANGSEHEIELGPLPEP